MGVQQLLLQYVVLHSKISQTDEDESIETVDWELVANEMNARVKATSPISPSQCREQFLCMTIPNQEDNKELSPQSKKRKLENNSYISLLKSMVSTSSGTSEVIQNILEQQEKNLIEGYQEETNAEHFQNLQSTTLLETLSTSLTQKQAQEEINHLHTITLEILNQRMLKFENRMNNLLKDVEDLCNVERMCLELERRDLFTARCRHWFG